MIEGLSAEKPSISEILKACYKVIINLLRKIAIRYELDRSSEES